MFLVEQGMRTVQVQVISDKLHLLGVLCHFSGQVCDSFHNLHILCMLDCRGVLEEAYIVALERQQVVNLSFVSEDLKTSSLEGGFEVFVEDW